MNKEILDKVDEIILTIKQSDDYQKYLLLKEKMNENSELKELIDEVRVLQKEIIHGKNKENVLKEKMIKLENNPLYREYNNTLSEINNQLALIENAINIILLKKLARSKKI